MILEGRIGLFVVEPRLVPDIPKSSLVVFACSALFRHHFKAALESLAMI